MKLILTTLLTVLPFSPVFAAKIIPHADISYSGSFAMPSSVLSNNKCFQWNYIQGNITYYHSGNGGNGSLFVTGRAGCPTLAEVSIPALKSSASYTIGNLNTASILQDLTNVGNGDINTGLPDGAWDKRGLGDVVVVGPNQGLSSDKLMIVTHTGYVVGLNDSPLLASINTNFSSSLGHSGWWKISTDGSTAVNPSEYQHYIFTIPTAWAKTNTGGKSVVVGSNRQNTGGSFGATMYAVGLGWGSTPPANDTKLSAQKLVSYGDSHNMKKYIESNTPPDLVWVKIGTKDSIIGTYPYPQRHRLYSETTSKNWLEHTTGWYYGNRHPEGSGDKGYHGEPYHYTLMFYDPSEIVSALHPHDVQPYAFYDVSSYFYRSIVQPGSEGENIGGIAYDESGHRLFVVESPSNATGGVAIVHVFDVSDAGSTLDTMAPSSPKNLQITSSDSTHVALSWTGSTDNLTSIAYIIYVNGYPVTRTKNTTYDYTNIDEWQGGDSSVENGWPSIKIFMFKVVSQDAYHNQSEPSNMVTHDSTTVPFPSPIIHK